MLKIVILLQASMFWFVLDMWFEQRLNSHRLIHILRDQEAAGCSAEDWEKGVTEA
jgi:hypothetical protein